MLRKFALLVLSAGLAFSSLPAMADHHGKKMAAQSSIVEIAAGNEQFSTLVTALTEAGLVETLQGEGPFTVFAPTNAAFDALPEGTLEALLADKEQLAAVLTYHVLPGKVMSADIAGKTLQADTVQGSALSIDATDGVIVDGANVVQADIKASNGVIHVINKVITP
ncbi:fasciclin domain-containing protein [Idiomarina seosinensis]|uniref:fasciclin domain-containing protein n=1 Tax=Idiomarina seosinensis TaxID=281739 RepID=UPI00384E021A